MNFKSILLIAAIAVCAVNVNAQSNDDSRVKILPTSSKGVLKMHYALKSEEPLQVKFLTSAGEFQTDKITGQFEKGFSKRYNVNSISDRDFWMEISSPSMTLIYKIKRSSDRKTFTPTLEKTIYNHVAVASK